MKAMVRNVKKATGAAAVFGMLVATVMIVRNRMCETY